MAISAEAGVEAGLPWASDGAPFRIGDVLQRSLTVIARRWWVAIGFPLIACATASVAMMPFFIRAAWVEAARGGARAPIDPTTSALLALSLALLAGAMCWVFAGAVHWACRAMTGAPSSVVGSLVAAGGRVFAALGLIVVFLVVTVLGWMLLIVPGYMMLTMFYVCMPALLVEDLGPFGALQRSAQLTKGCRWRVFGLHLLIGFGGQIIIVIVSNAALIAMGEVGAIVGGLFNLIVLLFVFPVLVAAIYHGLRRAKEGIPADRLVEVFD